MGFIKQEDAELSASINKHWREVAEYERFVKPLLVRLHAIEWSAVVALHSARWHREAIDEIRAPKREYGCYCWASRYYNPLKKMGRKIQRYPIKYEGFPIRLYPPDGPPVNWGFWFRPNDLKSSGWTPEANAWRGYVKSQDATSKAIERLDAERRNTANPRQYLADRLRNVSKRLGKYERKNYLTVNGAFYEEPYELDWALSKALAGGLSPWEFGELEAHLEYFRLCLEEFREAEKAPKPTAATSYEFLPQFRRSIRKMQSGSLQGDEPDQLRMLELQLIDSIKETIFNNPEAGKHRLIENLRECLNELPHAEAAFLHVQNKLEETPKLYNEQYDLLRAVVRTIDDTLGGLLELLGGQFPEELDKKIQTYKGVIPLRDAVKRFLPRFHHLNQVSEKSNPESDDAAESLKQAFTNFADTVQSHKVEIGGVEHIGIPSALGGLLGFTTLVPLKQSINQSSQPVEPAQSLDTLTVAALSPSDRILAEGFTLTDADQLAQAVGIINEAGRYILGGRKLGAGCGGLLPSLATSQKIEWGYTQSNRYTGSPVGRASCHA